MVSKQFADQFSKFEMPKKVDFVVPFLIQIDQSKETYCVEPFIEGDYRKHSNNAGFVEVLYSIT